MDFKSKVLSITRSVIRHAVSSILYHKICNSSPALTDETNRDNGENSSNSGLNSCFIDKDFCGLNLKLIAAVNDDDSIKNGNVFKITEWLENVVFANLDKGLLQAFNFAIVSIPIERKIDTTSQDCHSIHSDYNSEKSIIEIFKFKFDLEEGEKDNDDNTQHAKKASITKQVQILFTSLLELLDEVKKRPLKCKISMNFVLELKRDNSHHATTTSPSYNIMNMSQTSSKNDINMIFIDPLDQILNEINDVEVSKMKKAREKSPLVDIEGDIVGQSSIFEVNESTSSTNMLTKQHHLDSSQSSQLSKEGSHDNFETLAQHSFDTLEYLQRKNQVGKLFISHDNVKVCLDVKYKIKKIDIQDFNAVESLKLLFGQDILHVESHSLTTFASNEKISIRSISKGPQDAVRAVPPTMTPVRSRKFSVGDEPCHRNPSSGELKKRRKRKLLLDLSLSPDSCKSVLVTPKNSVMRTRKSSFSSRSQRNFDQGTGCMTTKTKSSSRSKFITPKTLKYERSPRPSSEAPTVVIRLSSCLASNSPLFASITPRKNVIKWDEMIKQNT